MEQREVLMRLGAIGTARRGQITSQNVYQWERRNGVIRVREATRAAILVVRSFGCEGGEGASGGAGRGQEGHHELASSLSDLDFCPPQTLCRQAASLQTVSFSRAHTQAVLALFRPNADDFC